jgi:hypothetical protein
MTCYRISHDEEPIALVGSLGLARRIVCCQPPGYYRLDKIRMGPPITLKSLEGLAAREPPHDGGQRPHIAKRRASR